MSLEDAYEDMTEDVDAMLAKEVRSGMRFTLLEETPYDCDTLSAEGQYPMFGEFLRIEHGDGEKYLEMTKQLVGEMIDATERGDRVGTEFEVKTCSKRDDEWQWNLEAVRDDKAAKAAADPGQKRF